jgi:hypothetical protein
MNSVEWVSTPEGIGKVTLPPEKVRSGKLGIVCIQEAHATAPRARVLAPAGFPAVIVLVAAAVERVATLGVDWPPQAATSG